MKKKVLLLIILCFCFLIVGCGKKENDENKLADDEVVLEGIKYKLDQDDEGYDIKSKVASNFRRTDLVNAINYFSENINGSAYFVKCSKCKINQDKLYHQRCDAVKAWNKRVKTEDGT